MYRNLIWLLVMVINGYSQDIVREAGVIQILEGNTRLVEEDANEDTYDAMYQLYLEPVELNSATAEQLANLYMLRPGQISSLLAHLQSNGPLVSIYELQAVEGMDAKTIQQILPFIQINTSSRLNSKNWRAQISSAKSILLLRTDIFLNKKAGYTTNKYLGSPAKYYARFRGKARNNQCIGFTLEKDAGEMWWDASKKIAGPDFLSFFAEVRPNKQVKRLVIGDFQLQFGQGLAFGAGLQLGKGTETVRMVKKNNTGLKAHTSVNEQDFFRGGALTLQNRKNGEATIFYSQTRKDATLELADGSQLVARGIQLSGLHRTASELQNRHVLTQRDIGGNWSQKLFHKSFHLGVNGIYTHYQYPIMPDPKPYNRYKFKGQTNWLVSSDFSYSVFNYNLFGEMGRSASGGMGMIVGGMAALSKQVEVAIAGRSYDRHFHTLAGQAFGDYAQNINEKGIYFGLHVRPSSRWDFHMYFDRYRFPWLKYLVDAPSQGHEALLKTTYRPAKKIVLFALVRHRNKQHNAPANLGTESLVIASKQSFQWQAEYTIPSMTLKSRLQGSRMVYPQRKSYGYLAMQDILFKFGRWSLGCRYALFDTDDYDNRQYVFERDVSYTVSLPAFAGKGTRFYTTCSYRITRWMALEMKYAHTIFEGVKQIGIGLEQINGNKVKSIHFQIKLMQDQ